MQLKPEVNEQDHIQGPSNAEVTLVEYGDYECPHCGRAHPIVKRLQKHFQESLRFVFRNFPLVEMHPMAEPAAEAAEFAGTKGKFWEMHDGIYEHQDQLSEELLLNVGKKEGLDTEGLAKAFEDRAFEDRIKKDFMSGVRSGVNGTPTFFINGRRFDGAPEYETLAAAIEAARGAKVERG